MLVRGLAILSRFVISCLSLEINGAGAKGFHSVGVLKCPAISRTTNRLALAQTFRDWEAIVLDSHSTDGSWEFFRSVASNDWRFRLYQIPREGVYAALNRGMELASGEFLLIATCDDTMHADFLATLLEAFVICPEAGIAACDVSLINRDGGQLTREDMASYLPGRIAR